MRRDLFRVTVLASAMGIASAKGDDQPRVAGWVSDEACGATHMKPGGADCVRKCLRGGASVGHPEWKPQRMVFVTDAESQVWVVENPKSLEGHEGDHVRVSGKFEASKKTVRVFEAEIIVEPAAPK